MGDGSLTQEEIDLLLQGADDISPAPGTAPLTAAGGGIGGPEMSPLERETVADIIHQALTSDTQGLGLILSRNVRLGSPYADVRQQDEIEREFGTDYVIFTQQCSGALNGTLGLFLPSDSAARISAIVMGNESADGVDAVLDSAQIATVKDAIVPMLSAVATQVSVKIGSAITGMPVDVSVPNAGAAFPITEGPSYLKIQIPFTVEGAVDSKINLVMPLPMAQGLYQLTKSQEQAAAGPGMRAAALGCGQKRLRICCRMRARIPIRQTALWGCPTIPEISPMRPC